MNQLIHPQEVVLTFFNALHEKSHEGFAKCLGEIFEDVLPNGSVVRSAQHLLALHKQFMTDPQTGFRSRSGEHRRFEQRDLEVLIESTDLSCGFYRVAAEVDRPTDFREANSPVVRLYMYLGVLVKNGAVVHIQNTLFDVLNNEPS